MIYRQILLNGSGCVLMPANQPVNFVPDPSTSRPDLDIDRGTLTVDPDLMRSRIEAWGGNCRHEGCEDWGQVVTMFVDGDDHEWYGYCLPHWIGRMRLFGEDHLEED